MKNLFKTITVSLAALAMTACSSTPENIVSYEKAGRVQSVQLVSKEKKPSFVELAAGATLGGLLGNQFGGGSGKYWTTAIGALGGAKIVDEALSEKYKEIHYKVRYNDGVRETLISRNLNPTVFKNDLVVITRYGKKYTIDAYGQYSRERMKILERKLQDGTLER